MVNSHDFFANKLPDSCFDLAERMLEHLKEGKVHVVDFNETPPHPARVMLNETRLSPRGMY